MDIERFRSSPAGLLIPIRGVDVRFGEYEHFALLPHPLAPAPHLGAPAWLAATAAAESLGRLWQACHQLPNPGLLIRPSLVKEAVATSALEGTYGTVSEVLEAGLPQFAQPTAEVREITAYLRMADLAFQWIRERPVTLRLLCDLQRVLADGASKPVREPGQVRSHQVVIGAEQRPIHEARFVPPPPGDQLKAALEDWLAWTQRPDHQVPAVVQAALAHYQFETLHPFSDGNGRIGRLVIVLQLVLAGSLPEPALTISPWLLDRREEYQAHLLRVSQTGETDEWIQFLCEGIKVQADAHVRVAAQLIDWLADARRRVEERRWTGVIFRVLDGLVEWPVLTVPSVADQHGISTPAAKSVVDHLVELGLLHERTGRTYRRSFAAQGVIDLVESL